VLTFPRQQPVLISPCPNGDVLLLPALWPVRLTPAERCQLAADLLDLDEEPPHA
jgi:hypothetical protein